MRYTFTPPQPKISAALEGHYCTGVFRLIGRDVGDVRIKIRVGEMRRMLDLSALSKRVRAPLLLRGRIWKPQP